MATNAKSVTELYQALRPLILRDVGATGRAADGSALEAHELAGPYHTGTILESQAPWAASKAEWEAALTSHVALPDVHHAQSHVLASTSGLGGDHTVSGLTARQVLRATGATTAAFGAIEDADIPSTIVRTSRTLTAGDGLSGLGDLSTDRTAAVALSAVSGLELVGTSPDKTLQIADTIAGAGLATDNKVLSVGIANTIQAGAGAGLSVETNGIRLTAGYDPGAATSILASDATGKLTLPLMVASTSLQTPLIIAGAGQSLTIQPPLDLYLNPTGNVIRISGNRSIQSDSFASGFAGYGWRVDYGVTSAPDTSHTNAEFDNLTVRGMLKVYELVIQQIRATNGSVFVSSAAKIESAELVSGSTYQLVVDGTENDYQPFAVGDVIRAQRVNLGYVLPNPPALVDFVYRCDLVVTAISVSNGDATQRTFRATWQAGTTVPAAKMEFVRLGNVSDLTRQGAVYLTSDDSGAPFIDIVNGITSHAYWNTAGKIKVRLGKLDGIAGGTNEYGLIAGNNGFTLNDTYLKASNSGVVLNNVPLDFRAGGNIVMALSPNSGSPYWSVGNPLPAGPLIDNGIWAGKDGTDYEFRVGTVSGGALVKGLHWTGTDLTWKATNTSLDASGNLVAGPVTLSSGGVTSEVTDYSNSSAYTFTSDGVEVAGIWGFANTAGVGATISSNMWPGFSTVIDAGKNAYSAISASAQDGKSAYTTLIAEVLDAYGAGINLAWIRLFAQSATSTIDLNADAVLANSKSVWHADMDASILPAADVTYNVGSAAKRWATIYANNMVISGSISGVTISGAEWQHAGSMIIDANAAANTTVSIVNQNAGAYTASLDVEGNITLTGNVDGVDLSGFKSTYDTHAGNVNAHHAQSHVLATNTALGADHTISGATAGYVLRASGATTALFAQLAHSDLGSIDADTHVSHAGVTLTAGAGLTGGGTIAASRSFAVGAGTMITVNADDVAVTAGATYQFIGTGSGTAAGWRNVSELAGNGLTATSGVLAVGAPSALSATTTDAVTADSHTHSISTAAATTLTVATTNGVGSSASLARADHTHDITTSSAITGATASILASDANGYLRLQRLGLGMAPSYPLDVNGIGRFSGALYADDILDVDGAAQFNANLYVGSNVLYVDKAGTRVGINRIPDAQFSLDVAGAIRGDYIIGKHAIQLASAVGVFHFDGPTPFNLNFNGTNVSHMGKGGTETGGVVYRPGRFGKAVQVAEATTNLVLNPSFEATTSQKAVTNCTLSLSDDSYVGSKSMQMLFPSGVSSANCILTYTTFAAGTTYTLQVRYKIISSGGVSWNARCNGHQGFASTGLVADGNWNFYTTTVTKNSIAAGQGIQIVIAGGTLTYDAIILVDAYQIEQKAYATPYCDGSLGQGHTWDGTEHASTSTRTFSNVAYPAQTLLNVNSGTIMAWAKIDAIMDKDAFVFGHYNSGNRISVRVGTDSQIAATFGYTTIHYSGEYAIPGEWFHVALSWSAGTWSLYVNGVAKVTGGTTSGLTALGTNLYVGGYTGASTYPFNGLVDELVILDYAADAKLIRAIVESDAPVFVESSVFHWRAPGAANIWVDERGFWASSLTNAAIFGIYTGDPAKSETSKSWGGVNLYDNDILIGRSPDGYVHWDDSAATLNIKGVITSTSGTIGGWTLGATSLVSGSAGTTVGLDSGGTNPAFYAGSATPSSAPFRVTAAGVLTATNATITGSITANSGSIAGALTIGSSGGIYQGSGTFASPTTGLKIWNDGGTYGRIGGYNTGTLQWYAGTDGKLYAGGGNVKLDAGGILLSTSSSETTPNIFFGATSGDYAYAEYRTWASSSKTLELMSIASSKSSIALRVRNAGQANSDNGSIILTQDAYVSSIVLKASTVLVEGGGLRIGGDPGGAASTVAISNVTYAVTSTTGYIRMNGTIGLGSNGWIKMYVGTTAVYVPYWTAI